MAALQELTNATEVGSSALESNTASAATAADVAKATEEISQAGWDGTSDEATTKKLHADAYGKDRVNVTGAADKAYQDVLNNPNATTADIGHAQRGVMLAFQVQYPNASVAEFQSHMDMTVKGSTADANRQAAATGSYQKAEFFDQAIYVGSSGSIYKALQNAEKNDPRPAPGE